MSRYRNANFESTQWSLVLKAQHRTLGSAREALSTLCELYWYPLYAYARQRLQKDDAQDVTQAFFVMLLEKELISKADPRRGRFRSFLLSSFQNFLANEWDRRNAQKRGGGLTAIHLDFSTAESHLQIEDPSGLSAEQIFEQQWLLRLLDQVLDRLGEEFDAAGQQGQFRCFKDFIGGSPSENAYSELARTLGATENAVRVAVHRFRKRYRTLLRNEIARTVADPGDVDDEISYLMSLIG